MGSGVWCPVILGLREPAPDHRPSRIPVQESLVLLILCILCIHVNKPLTPAWLGTGFLLPGTRRLFQVSAAAGRVAGCRIAENRAARNVSACGRDARAPRGIPFGRRVGLKQLRPASCAFVVLRVPSWISFFQPYGLRLSLATRATYFSSPSRSSIFKRLSKASTVRCRSSSVCTPEIRPPGQGRTSTPLQRNPARALC